MRLKDKVAIVTGAGQGIGRAIAERFAEEGAWVALAEINDTGAEVEKSLRAAGHAACFLRTDVADAASRAALAEKVLEERGQIDILVNNAAIYFPRSALEMSPEDWRKLLAVNLDAVFFLSQAVGQQMVYQGGGRIVNVASIMAYLTAPDTVHYNAAKAGVVQITRTLAVEFAPSNVLVNALAPGFIRTPMSIVRGVDETETEFFLTFYVQHRRIPLARPGHPSEVASAALFLASDDCQYITGHVLVVDGGLSVTF